MVACSCSPSYPAGVAGGGSAPNSIQWCCIHGFHWATLFEIALLHVSARLADVINGAGLVEAIDIAVLTGHLQDEALRFIYDADGHWHLSCGCWLLQHANQGRLGAWMYHLHLKITTAQAGRFGFAHGRQVERSGFAPGRGQGEGFGLAFLPRKMRWILSRRG